MFRDLTRDEEEGVIQEIYGKLNSYDLVTGWRRQKGMFT